jgi:hypothetical protein
MKTRLVLLSSVLLIIPGCMCFATLPVDNEINYSYSKGIHPDYFKLTHAIDNINIIKVYQYLQQSSQKTWLIDNSLSNTLEDFSLNYTARGGIANLNIAISYNSKTNELVVNNDNSPKPPPHLSDSEKQNLKDIIIKNNFFKTLDNYPPSKDVVDYLSYKLSIKMNNNTHTTSWTDGSSPEATYGLFKIADKIVEIFLR